MVDILESFEKLRSGMYIPYRGALIKQPTTPTSPYIWNETPFSTLLAAQNAIDAAYESLKDSVNNQNHLP